ncbi:MAG: hypothetical protein HYZ28_17955 [Myxococcales bacterium]|nr:hypothetical protein [Myxococcales bacterium]
MLAQLQDAVPAGQGWVYEPKWDGFRALASRSWSPSRVALQRHRARMIIVGTRSFAQR